MAEPTLMDIEARIDNLRLASDALVCVMSGGGDLDCPREALAALIGLLAHEAEAISADFLLAARRR